MKHPLGHSGVALRLNLASHSGLVYFICEAWASYENSLSLTICCLMAFLPYGLDANLEIEGLERYDVTQMSCLCPSYLFISLTF